MTPEFGTVLCSTFTAVKKPVSVLVDKRGRVSAVFVGDANNDTDISSFFKRRHETRRGIRNYRLVHIRACKHGLTENDKFTLINERLEMVGVLKMPANGSDAAAGFEVVYPVSFDNSSNDSKKWETVKFKDYRNVKSDVDSALVSSAVRRSFNPSLLSIIDEKCVFLVGIGQGSQFEAEKSLEEFTNLAVSADKKIMGSRIYMSKRSRSANNTVVGEKKLNDVLLLARHKGAGTVIFDAELAPSEISEIQSRTDMKIIDRTQLILEIFSLRASSKEGKIQVRLAELKYALPRLSGKGIQMSQPGAGIGTKGPGEKSLEKERRRLRSHIRYLERQTCKISERRERTRVNRKKQHAKIVSLVGYTNAGKSTLFSALTKEHTEIADRMFSTLGTKTRRIYSPENTDILLTDTVGFIKDLPEDLTAAFRATLEEIGEARLLLHVADTSDQLVENQINTVERIVDSMGFGSVQRLLVFNKIDKASNRRLENLSFIYPDAVFVSALSRKNLEYVANRISFLVKDRRRDGFAIPPYKEVGEYDLI